MKKRRTNSLLMIGSQMTTGGAQRALLQLACWFHNRGYAVTVAFFYDKDGLYKNWCKSYPFELVNLNAWSREKKGFLKLCNLPLGLIKLFNLMRRGKFSYVIAYTHHSNLLAIPLAWLVGIPVRLATHRGRIYGFPHWQEKLHAWLINSGIATALLAVSESTKMDAVEEGVAPEHIIVIPNGVDLPEVNKEIGNHLRQVLGINPNQCMFFYAGRLNYEKGPDLLLQAFSKVIEVTPDAKLVLAGDGPLRTELESLVRQLDIENNVVFLGVRNDVPAMMMGADVFVLSSRSEGMPNAVLEAMALSTPVVAFNVGGVKELLQDGLTGRLSSPDNPDALAMAMIELAMNGDERKELALAGKKFVDENYKLDKISKRYEDLLSSLLHQEAESN